MNAADLLTTGSPRASMINLPLYKEIILVPLLLVTQIFAQYLGGTIMNLQHWKVFLRKEEGSYYPRSLKVWTVHVERSHPLLKNSYKNPPFMIY
jgi:hypothetical protein